jgi:dipeptidyl aminopeptidase/acylaminoacyl peptidase
MPPFCFLPAPFVRLFALTALAASTANILAQTGRTYTDADYARAEQLMNYNVEPLVYHGVDKPGWLDGERFWYRDRGPEGFTFVLVDPVHGTRRPIFDHAAIAAALAGKVRQVKQPLNPANLPIEDLDVSADDKVVHFRIGPDLFRCDIGGQVKCERATDVFVGQDNIDYDISPDGQRGAFIRDNNLWVRDRAGRETQLTKDGVQDFGYATDNAGWTHSDKPILVWSPDSKKIATFQQDQRNVGRMYLVSTAVGHPELKSWPYPLAGDEHIITIQPVVIDVDARKVVRLKMAPEPHRSSLCDDVSCEGGHGWDDVQWSADNKHIAIVSTSRDHKQEWLRVADAKTGEAREVMTESVPTYFESSTGDRVNWRYLADSNEVLWFSQRDNWGQMYLYDASTGKLKNQITHGSSNVKKVLAVDEKARVMYFLGEGKEAGWDPYFTALYRVNLDGSGLKLLTPETANHDITASDDGTLFVDVASTPTTPAKSVVRDREGKVVMSIADQDITKLVASGWKPLTPITTKARDGKTDLYGFMFKPTDFDESKRYPVVEWVYPGPQVGSCGDTRRFTPAHRDMQSLAELGFVVLCVDGLGTPGRSKNFHDALFGDLADNTIPDQVAAVKQLAAKYPWIDGERVGIYGHSGGGAATGAAMFHFPDFFKVGISESGNHDNREYEDDWAEKWLGLLKRNPDGTTNYDSQANQNSAKNLKGHLLLMHGTMDDNVPPNNTLLVVDALIKANKDFDLIMLPNKHHGYGDDTPYATRRRWDYFVRYLAGGEPPHEYKMKPYDEEQEALGKSGK